MKPSGSRQVRSPRAVAGTGLVVCALAALSALAGSSVHPAAAATPLLPDLVADPPSDSAPPEVYTDQNGTSLLLRFDGYVHNRGAGALDIRATAPVSDRMSVVQQRVYDSGGGFVDTAQNAVLRYEPADGHNHWHLRNAAAYSLWNEAKTAQVGASNKVGFCLVDTAHVDPFGPTVKAYTTAGTGFCQQGNPGAQSVYMGVSPGWRDVYSRFLAFQWVDISDVRPGRYWLRSEVDPDGVVTESDEINAAAFAAAPSIVNGYVANSFARKVGILFGSSIPLQATTFDDVHPGSPGTRQFRIDAAPRNGTLNQPVGVWFTASSVTYTPRFGYWGQDSFQFSARDATSQFPIHPVSATASIGVGVNPAPVAAATQPGVSAARTAAAPDVQTAPPAPGADGLGQPVVSRVGPWVLVSAVAGRDGVVRMSAAQQGASIGGCVVNAPAGAVVTCRFDHAGEHGHDHGSPATGPPVVAGVTLDANDGKVISRGATG